MLKAVKNQHCNGGGGGNGNCAKTFNQRCGQLSGSIGYDLLLML